MKFATSCVHAGVAKDPAYNSVITPIYPTSTFAFERIGVNKGYDYTRSGNPTRAAIEENIAALEGGLRARCTCTGMGACTIALFLLEPGAHVIAGHDIYGGAFRLMHEVFAQRGLLFSFVDMRDPENVRSTVRDETAMIWIETPSNPLLRIVDIVEVAGIARECGALSVVDNTFMTPYYQKPLELGADIVIHSTTKYLNGHSDVVGGALVAKEADLADKVAWLVNALGVGESPFDAWLVLRGTKTLSQRMQAHSRNAQALADFLSEHPAVNQVYYPGLASHPQHLLATRQMSGFGGMLSFELAIDKITPDDFFSALQYFALAESLGGVESLIEAPWHMSHASMPEPARREAGITPGTIRISAGIEDPDDLIADLRAALG
ncbi:MAG: cystathionine gamma-synthase [Chitinivibrionales bacterium]|nr:cystathionine gamma-synthase [Chitinivibrionales bacterium]